MSNKFLALCVDARCFFFFLFLSERKGSRIFSDMSQTEISKNTKAVIFF